MAPARPLPAESSPVARRGRAGASFWVERTPSARRPSSSSRSGASAPASVCYDVIEEAERRDADLVLIDTAGRLHTSADLMQELAKVVNVTRKRAKMPVSVVLVIDATTGQNGLNQAKEFNDALDLDGLIITKLDGTAKGGIALAVSSQLGLPIYRIGVGESIDDLQSFDAHDFCAALVGEGM